MRRRAQGASRFAQACAAITLFYLLRLLPESWGRAFCRAVLRTAYRWMPRLHRVGRANLDLAYGDSIDSNQKEAILREAIDSMADVVAELPHLPRLFQNRFEGRLAIEGEEHLLPGGGLFVSAHFANWEWIAPGCAYYGLDIAGVARPFNHPRLDRLIDRTRRAAGIVTIPKDDAGGEVLRLLQEGWKIGILIDQSPRENAVPTTFFGHACWSTVAPAMIALRAKVPVYPASLVRTGTGRYTLRLHPALPIEKSGSFQEDLVRITQQCQDAIEGVVRQHPGQWLWFHRRWKTRPKLEADWAKREARNRKRAERSAVSAPHEAGGAA